MDTHQALGIGSGRTAYLAYLEENGLSEADVLPLLAETDEATNAKVAEILKQAERAGHTDLVQRFRRASSGNTNLLLEQLSTHLTDRLVQAGLAVPANSFAGVYPTNSFNAHVVKRAGVNVILVNSGTFELVGPIAALLCSLQPGNARAHARKAASLLRAYCEARQLPGSDDLQDLRPSGDQMTAAVALSTSIEEFIVAHEYGHLANGDVGDDVTELSTPSGHAISVAVKTKDQEFAADLWAAHAVTQGSWANAGEEECILKCSGPLMFLSMAGLIEAWFESKGHRSDTHPPAGDRYIELITAFAKAGMYRYTELAITFDQFCWLVAEELGVAIERREAQLLVVGHVGGMVQDGLQEAISIPSQGSRIYMSTRGKAPTKQGRPWWQFWSGIRGDS